MIRARTYPDKTNWMGYGDSEGLRRAICDRISTTLRIYNERKAYYDTINEIACALWYYLDVVFDNNGIDDYIHDYPCMQADERLQTFEHYMNFCNQFEAYLKTL